MTVHEVADALIYLGGIAVAVASIGVVLRYLVVRPLKKWITEQAAPAAETLRQVEPNGSGNKSTTRQLIERLGDQLTEHGEQLSGLTTAAADNRAIAEEARIIAKQASERLDAHIQRHGGE